jgi:DnaK suppressor protein
MDTSHYKEKLQTEKDLLIKELRKIGGIKNEKNPDDWEARPSNLDIQQADPNEVADKIESYEGNTAIVSKLEQNLREIDEALVKIEKGTFGICEECGQKIETDRLEAHPSAKTCKAHMK